ncbi:unnamed protein product [Ilex paraguariensis]|uniref:RNase H type-1 domain-containing protein n=1 Tax=Ilex paraguariensis TaxID=185542 RepID=A0ABC8SBU7_9AQUA
MEYALAIWTKISQLIGFQLIPNEAPLTRFKRLNRIYRQLWKERCIRLYEDHKKHPSTVVMLIMNNCKLQVHNARPKAIDTQAGLEFLSSLNVSSVRRPIVLAKWINWDFPREGWLKLNTDGSSKGNPGILTGITVTVTGILGAIASLGIVFRTSAVPGFCCSFRLDCGNSSK